MEQVLISSTTPFTPPTTEDDRLSWLRLIRSRKVGPVTFHRLLAEHGSAPAALAALPEMARAAGIRDYEPCPERVALAEMAAGRRAGMTMILWGTPEYPAELADLPDAPPILWLRGDPARLFAPMVAIVGARNTSSLGVRMAARLARDLGAAGLTVVSGLARGIDAAAHDAALPGGTVAVLAGGADVIYPQENTGLAARIAGQGAILSEQPPGLEPQARHFPLRNRIISGLSLGVVVVEAAERSGSLITARNALDQGREVMAVPGHPVDARAGGCNTLIRDGCTLIRRAEDVIEAIAQPLIHARQMREGMTRPLPRPPPSAPARLMRAARDLVQRGTSPPAPGPAMASQNPEGPSARAQDRDTGRTPDTPKEMPRHRFPAPDDGAALPPTLPRGDGATHQGSGTAQDTPARHSPMPEGGSASRGPNSMEREAPAGSTAPHNAGPSSAQTAGGNGTPTEGGAVAGDSRDRESGPAWTPAPVSDRNGSTKRGMAPPPGPRDRDPDTIRALHRAILSRLGPAPLAEDQLLRDLALPSARVAPELLALELEGRIERRPGGLLSRIE